MLTQTTTHAFNFCVTCGSFIPSRFKHCMPTKIGRKQLICKFIELVLHENHHGMKGSLGVSRWSVVVSRWSADHLTTTLFTVQLVHNYLIRVLSAKPIIIQSCYCDYRINKPFISVLAVLSAFHALFTWPLCILTTYYYVCKGSWTNQQGWKIQSHGQTKPKGVTIQMKALEKWCCLCYYRREFVFVQTKPKGVTIQMKALDE